MSAYLETSMGQLRGRQSIMVDQERLDRSTTPPVPIRTAQMTDAQRLIDVLVLAFSADPAVRWMYPDPHQYLTHFPAFIRAFGGKAFGQGTAYAIDGFAGALWLPPGIGPDEEALIALLERSVPERDWAEVFGVFEQMGSFHPSEPHWYLPLIGVDVTQQGRGYGSALMKHALTRCDQDKLPAYLESTNPANIPLYERHGFERMGTIQAGSSPPIFPMWRRPR